MSLKHEIWPGILRGPVGKQQYVALVRDVSVQCVTPLPRIRVTVRAATRDDFPALDNIMHSENYTGLSLTRADMDRRFEAGDACLVVTHGSDIAAWSWIRFDNGSFSKKWLNFPLHPGEAYIHTNFTRPSYRRQGLATLLSVVQMAWLGARGVRLAYLWIAPWNYTMRGIAARTGSIEVGQVTQHYLRGVGRPLINTVTIFDRPQSLGGWFSPSRMQFPGGLIRVRHDRGLVDDRYSAYPPAGRVRRAPPRMKPIF